MNNAPNIQASLQNHKLGPIFEKNICPSKVQNLSMHYYNLFFLKHDYTGYDRFIVANTCILLSAKLLDLHREMTPKFLVSNFITM